MEAPQCPILSLPLDVLSSILHFLPVSHLPNLALSCSSFRTLLSRDEIWRRRLSMLGLRELFESHPAAHLYRSDDSSILWRDYFIDYYLLRMFAEEFKPMLHPEADCTLLAALKRSASQCHHPTLVQTQLQRFRLGALASEVAEVFYITLEAESVLEGEAALVMKDGSFCVVSEPRALAAVDPPRLSCTSFNEFKARLLCLRLGDVLGGFLGKKSLAPPLRVCLQDWVSCLLHMIVKHKGGTFSELWVRSALAFRTPRSIVIMWNPMTRQNRTARLRVRRLTSQHLVEAANALLAGGEWAPTDRRGFISSKGQMGEFTGSLFDGEIFWLRLSPRKPSVAEQAPPKRGGRKKHRG